MATKAIQKCKFSKGGLRVISIRSGIYSADESSPTSADTVSLSIPSGNSQLKVREVQVEESNEVELNEASIIVSAGRGVGGTEGCEFVRPLATELGAAFGASRAVCDAGWLPHKHQVGQTGTMVNPDFYFAMGISGAIQHWVGAMAAKNILAINTDPEANMVTKAGYAVLGDLHEVIPAITAEIRNRREA